MSVEELLKYEQGSSPLMVEYFSDMEEMYVEEFLDRRVVVDKPIDHYMKRETWLELLPEFFMFFTEVNECGFSAYIEGPLTEEQLETARGLEPGSDDAFDHVTGCIYGEDEMYEGEPLRFKNYILDNYGTVKESYSYVYFRWRGEIFVLMGCYC